MSTPARTVSAFCALATALVLASCSQDAESAQDQGSLGFDAATPAEGRLRATTETSVVAEPASAVTAPVPVMAERPPPPSGQKPAAPRPPASGQAPVPDATEPVNAPLNPQPTRAFVAAGTQVSATVVEELTTARSRVGDRFHATLADDVLGANGEVLLPKGAVLNGRVAESRESGAADDPAALSLEVESVTAGGRTLSLQAEVVELDAQIGERDSGNQSAVKVGVGAAAGAAIGRILGRDRGSALKGAVVGAAAGTALAMATRDGHAVVKPGARMVVRLT